MKNNFEILKRYRMKKLECFMCETEIIFKLFPNLQMIKFSKDYAQKICVKHKEYFKNNGNYNIKNEK